MELTHGEIIQKMVNFVDIAIEIHYFHMNMNLLAFQVLRGKQTKKRTL